MKSLSIDLNDRASENSITKRLSEIDEKEINLQIRNDSNGNVEKMRLNVHLFSKIKEIQDLPDWVIIKLLLAEGKLKNSDFNKRLLNG
jgi:hypothetical protein